MKIFKRLITAICCISLCFAAYAVNSPDGRISVKNTRDGLTLQCGDTPLLNVMCGKVSEIGTSVKNSVGYTMLTGKKKHCTNAYVEQSYRLAQGDTLIVRVYNDGVAWKKTGTTRVQLVKPVHTWLQEWTDCYEGFFPKDRQLSEGMRIGYPALVEYKGGIFGLLTESGISSDEAGVSMHSRGGYVFDLIPDGPENGGWQTFITGTLSDVVESTLVTDNSAPSLLTDVSWIEPGVAAWVYWAYNHGSNDFDIIARYVDLAAELRLPYVLIDAEWDTMKDGKTVEDAVAYALSKGVKPMIWYNSSIGWVDGAPTPKFRLNTPESLEKEFAWCEKIGVKGVKIDFFSGDTNRNMKFMTELLDAAARHGLLVNFHGSPLPRGWQRTYPNFITTESVYGAEWYNNVPTFTDKAAAHNATLPFTRNVIGSMDYTPCAFSDSQHPHITTHAHELALTALYESGIQHLADRPESLLAQPREVRDYFGKLPAAWDETLLLGGYPGEYVIMARRKGADWWISAINGTDRELKNIKVDYSRLVLPASGMEVQIFEDATPGSAAPWHISKSTQLPAAISMQPRGGVVMTVKTGPVVTGDFRDFGLCRPDTVVTLDCGELKTDNRNPLFYADYRDGVEVAFNVRFNTFLTEQAVVCREATPGSKIGTLTVGYDPGSEKIFAEVMQSDGTPCRIVAGPDVTDSRTYAVRVKSLAQPRVGNSNVTSLLTLNVYPADTPADSVLKENNNSATYNGDALPYLPGNWIVGHGYPGGFPNSLQLRKGEVSDLAIKCIGRAHATGSNPLFTDRFTADPAGLVTNGRMYLYVGEDCAAPGGWFSMPHWVAYSTDDMVNWVCHGRVLAAADFPHSNPNGAWAAQVVEKDGKCYFYVTLDDVRNGEHKIDVAVGDSPLGPFRPARQADSPLITDSMTASHRHNADIDPTVLIDDDGSAWIAWGNGDCYLARLKDNMIELDGDIIHLGLRNYSEGPWLFKRDGKYYNVYAADAPGVQPEQMAYSMADNITGPWTYGGLLTGPARYGFTIHPSVNEFNGSWYLFYHDGCYAQDGTAGGDCRRHVCAERLTFNPDGTIAPVTLSHQGIAPEK